MGLAQIGIAKRVYGLELSLEELLECKFLNLAYSSSQYSLLSFGSWMDVCWGEGHMMLVSDEWIEMDGSMDGWTDRWIIGR